MNRGTASLFTCPECSGGKLHLEEYLLSDGDSDQVIDGRLVCADCGNWYRIEKGIVDLLPFRIKRLNYGRFVLRDVGFAEKYGLTLPAPAESENGVPLNKTKPMGAFEDVANYENNVVNNRFYKALDQTAFLEWMTQNLKARRSGPRYGLWQRKAVYSHGGGGNPRLGLGCGEDMLMLVAKKIGEKSLGRLVDLIVADGENPPVKENHFTGCVLYGVLHHLSEKKVAVLNASSKILPGGLMYSLDPHKSFLRFIFDFLMRKWQLWVEEASEDPLITEEQIRSWMAKGGVRGKTRLSTYIPPHVFIGGLRANVWLLKVTDMAFSHIPGLRKAGGVIIFDGKKDA